MVNSIFTNRRAVRNFSSESISDDEIKSLIAAFKRLLVECIRQM